MERRAETMSTEIYHFKVGAFECTAVSDGTLTYAPPIFPPPTTLLFANAPKERLDEILRQHNLQAERWAEWISPYICLVVNTGEHRVLVDTGAGGLAPSTGRLLENLRASGTAPESIDTVILTHGHPDHIGGNIDAEGKPAFPNARYVMWKAEWDFWTSGEAEQKLHEEIREVLVTSARKNLPPIQDRLELVDREGEIMPGISAVAAPGHTPGHMAVAISSGGEELLCVADAILHPVHVEQPQWFAAVDFAPEQVVTTRRSLLSRAAAENALVLAFHFPFPGMGHVVAKGEGWEWQPTETTS
jgi:glyoxylase-like metal-dependent hydrolase (beta-lactamase superfamily II)